MGMLGPELLVYVPAVLWECWAQSRSGHPPQGDQPEDWWAPSRETGFATGNPTGIFLTRRVFSSPSRWSSTRCRRTWYDDQHGLTSIARCPRSLYGFPFFSPGVDRTDCVVWGHRHSWGSGAQVGVDDQNEHCPRGWDDVGTHNIHFARSAF